MSGLQWQGALSHTHHFETKKRVCRTPGTDSGQVLSPETLSSHPPHSFMRTNCGNVSERSSQSQPQPCVILDRAARSQESPALLYLSACCTELDLSLSLFLYLSHRLCFTTESWNKLKVREEEENEQRIWMETNSLRNPIGGGLTRGRCTLVHLELEV